MQVRRVISVQLDIFHGLPSDPTFKGAQAASDKAQLCPFRQDVLESCLPCRQDRAQAFLHLPITPQERIGVRATHASAAISRPPDGSAIHGNIPSPV